MAASDERAIAHRSAISVELAGEYEGPYQRRVSLLTNAVTAGELRQYIGREMTFLSRSCIRVTGELVDVQMGTAVVADGAGELRIPLDELVAIRVRRVRDRGGMQARVHALEAEVAELRRRVGNDEAAALHTKPE